VTRWVRRPTEADQYQDHERRLANLERRRVPKQAIRPVSFAGLPNIYLSKFGLSVASSTLFSDVTFTTPSAEKYESDGQTAFTFDGTSLVEINEGGVYAFFGQAHWASAVGGWRGVLLSTGGDASIDPEERDNPAPSTSTAQSASGIQYCTAGTSCKLRVAQNSGSPVSVDCYLAVVQLLAGSYTATFYP
jgi:hypothetical protein